MKPRIRLSAPGIFLFRAPHELDLTVDREMVLVVHLVQPQATAVLVCDALCSPRDLVPILDELIAKLMLDLDQAPGPVYAKIFGLSHDRPELRRTVNGWLRSHGFSLDAQDVGRHTTRNLTILCETGAVGVSYQQSIGSEPPLFLHRGSARSRIGAGRGPAQTQVLVLTENPVWRQLAAQSIEEQPGFHALCPESPRELADGEDTLPGSVFGVLIFPDLASRYPNTLVRSLHRSNPSLRVGFCAEELPHEPVCDPIPALLPALRPETIAVFKAALKSLWEREITAEGLLLPFRRQRSR